MTNSSRLPRFAFARRRRKATRLLVTGALPLVVLIAGSVVVSRAAHSADDGGSTRALRAVAARGTLAVVYFGAGPGTTRPSRLETVLVNGDSYAGMEDNDLRGFLDGTFKYGWNQVSQAHVRLGRRGESPAFGEYELFRVLQRWEPIRLPPRSTVREARLELTIEEGPEMPIRVMLYAVRSDWNPGRGGVRGDNVSPPRPGEVWWNEATHQTRAWGLPGASFASAAPNADTDPMPLADATYDPGRRLLVFESSALASYLSTRIREQRPALFLLKLTDAHEDIPRSLLTIYSGNFGDSRTTAWRPRLVIGWESASEQQRAEHAVFLEYGRTMSLHEPLPEGAEWAFVDFAQDSGYSAPTVRARTEATDAWVGARRPVLVHGDRLEVNVQAARNPHVLNRPFVAEFRDTWIRSAPPEDQIVPWTFESPTGVRHEVLAEYVGDYRWRVRFQPDELGPWRYQWQHSLYNIDLPPVRMVPGSFDVLPGEKADVRCHLVQFAARVRESDGSREQQERLMIRLSKLERAAMALETPESFRSEDGQSTLALLRYIRSMLDEPPPQRIPMAADAGPGWRHPSGGVLASIRAFHTRVRNRIADHYAAKRARSQPLALETSWRRACEARWVADSTAPRALVRNSPPKP